MNEVAEEVNELELKFEVTDDQLKRLRDKRVLKKLGVAKPETATLRSVYYDTSDLLLRARGMSLRIRQIGDRWVQTLKAGRGVIGGVSRPLELERSVAGDDKIDRTALPGQVKKLLQDAPLEPVFETVISRTTNLLRAGDGSQIEVAFDSGKVIAGDQKQPISEVEIELKSGNPASVFAIARKLAAGEALRFSSLSKAERGYRTVERIPAGAPVAVRYQSGILSGDEALDEVYRSQLRSCAQQISHNWQVVLDTSDTDGPHQLRISLRRLRSMLQAFEGVIRAKPTRKLTDEARRIAALVGELRDIDVLATEIVPAVAKAHPHDTDLAELQARLGALQADTRENVKRRLAGDRIVVFVLHLGKHIEAPPWRRKRSAARLDKATERAGNALDKSWHRVERWGRNVGQLSLEKRHAMRKALKRLRYQTEAFEPFYAGGQVKPFIKKLKVLQDVFGYLNDVAMAEKLRVLDLGKDADPTVIDRAAGQVLDWHTAQADKAWKNAERAWKSLERSKKFWRS